MAMSQYLAYAICNGYFDLSSCPVPEEAGATTWDAVTNIEMFKPYHTKIMEWLRSNSDSIKDKVTMLYRYADTFSTHVRMQMSASYLFYFANNFPDKLPRKFAWAVNGSPDSGNEYAKEDRDSFASWVNASSAVDFETLVDTYLAKVPAALSAQVPESPYLAAKVVYVLENPSVLTASQEISNYIESKNYTQEEAAEKTLPALPRFKRAFKEKAVIKLLNYLKREDSLQPSTPDEEAGCREVKGICSLVRNIFHKKPKVDVMDMLSYSVMQNLISTGAIDKNKIDPESLKATIEDVLNPKKTTTKVAWSSADKAIENLESNKSTFVQQESAKVAVDIFEKTGTDKATKQPSIPGKFSIRDKCLALGVIALPVNFLTINNVFIYIFAALCIGIGFMLGRKKK